MKVSVVLRSTKVCTDNSFDISIVSKDIGKYSKEVVVIISIFIVHTNQVKKL